MVTVIGVSLVSDVWRTKFEAFHVGILLQRSVQTRRAKRELLSEMDTKQSGLRRGSEASTIDDLGHEHDL